MRFRYRDKRGRVVPLPDVASLLWAIREGAVLPETPLAVDEEQKFQKAALVVAYQQAAAAVGRGGRIPSASVPASSPSTPPWHAKRSVRIVLAVGLVVLLAAVASLRIQSIGREHAREFASKPTGPAPPTQAAIARLEGEFGDSAALAQHRLEDWVAHQHFAERLRGPALRAPASLRLVRSAAANYRTEIDSLQARTRSLAVALVRRADSAESRRSSLAGLMASVEDALVDWQRELGVYAELQRATAATLDSLADFVLERQQSFAVRDGRPVFLSRTDAADFRGLADNLGSLAVREKAWADALLGRRPYWMTTLPEESRPRFGRNPLSGPASNSP